MSNHLVSESSPYLLQHVENPVDWYPWCNEAFEKAKSEDKPVFLSVGYSTCHWCHVMAHESFENLEIAEILRENFISIKVDREERPDVDSIYMTVCQSFTGSGGWPMSIFMDCEGKPFFAGTYFPKEAFKNILVTIAEKWKSERDSILAHADEIVDTLRSADKNHVVGEVSTDIFNAAISQYKESFDSEFGGFGRAPKFPIPHNILFLLGYYEKTRDVLALRMAEVTVEKMYTGGMFDHIGGGFSRYSTDRYFLVPHFEKMLYDNALLITAYCRAYEVTSNPLFLTVAEKTAAFIIHEMTSEDGGFFSAEDADSEGEEGKYYIFDRSEIISVLGQNMGTTFNEYYGITDDGNFEGKSIPNLLNTNFDDKTSKEIDKYIYKVYDYRKKRNKLHMDDKILLSWNSLMISAMCSLYRISGKVEYLNSASKAYDFVDKNMTDGNRLFVSYRLGSLGKPGFIDDYANYIYALLSFYEATLKTSYLERAQEIMSYTIENFYDKEIGGFYLYSNDNEDLIYRPKEMYDGAIPSGNSMITLCLVRLNYISPSDTFSSVLEKQINFTYSNATKYPMGYAMFINALLQYFSMPEKITVVLKAEPNFVDAADLPLKAPLNSIIQVVIGQTEEYKLLNDKTTFYICKNHNCLPPQNAYTR